MRENTKVVVDDTTIYEVDLNCYHCLSEQERHKYFPRSVWEKENGKRELSDRMQSKARK